MIQLNDNIVSSLSLKKLFHGGEGQINSLDFSRDGSVMCCASDDESIRIYDADRGVESGKLVSRKYGVELIKFTNSNRTVLHASKNGWNDTIRYLSLQENSYLRYFTGHRAQVVSLSVCPTDETFMSASDDNTVRLWDLRSPTCQGMIHKVNRISACFDPAGIMMAVGSYPNVINFYDRRNFDKEPFATFQIKRQPFQWLNMEIDRTGKYILALTDCNAMIIDAFNGDLLEEFTHPVPTESLTSISLSPDSEYVSVGISDCKILTWKARNSNNIPLIKLDGHKKPVRALRWNPAKAFIASSDTQVRFWVPDS